jgi:DNA-binding MarR family transcriptional regulator
LDRQRYLNAYAEKFMVHRKVWEAEWVRQNKSGLSSTQAMMLLVLHNQGPQQAKDLMGLLGVSSGGVTVISDKLTSLGVIRKTKDERDRRAVFLEITDQGRAFMALVQEEWDLVMNNVFSVLTDVEVAILLQLFAKLSEVKE